MTIQNRLVKAFTQKVPRKVLHDVDCAILGLSDALLVRGNNSAARRLRDVTCRK